MNSRQTQSLISRHHVKPTKLQKVLASACCFGLCAFSIVALNASTAHAAVSQEELWVSVPSAAQSMNTSRSNCVSFHINPGWVDAGITVSHGEALIVNAYNSKECNIGGVTPIVFYGVVLPNLFQSSGRCTIDLARKVVAC